MIKSAAICPHPPIIIPDIGGAQLSLVKKTVAGMEACAQEIHHSQPDTIVIISPHGPMRYDKFTINLEDRFRGDFLNFGGSSMQYVFQNNIPLAKTMLQKMKARHFPVEVIREAGLDHGTLVPLHFLTKPYDKKPSIIPLTFTALDWNMHFEYGKEIGKILQDTEESISIIASGDLSHRLTEDAPAGFSPYGIKFDHAIAELLAKNDISKILNLNPDFCDEAGECGLRSIIITLGVISELKYSFKQLSYEGPFGVGYLVGQWRIN
ncbi:MAG: AmmeMemoRadiSam system protein B [Patescibacteria group bacterium]|nr:AmmeMemoRadiSam system protein B [Patescibacteria group bacterium]